MPDKTDPSWSKSSVLKYLAQTKLDRPRLHVFLEDGPTSDMDHVPDDIVNAADPERATKVGGVRKLSRSFWVEGKIDTLRRIAESDRVKAILPAEIDDVLPRPVGKRKPRK